MSHTNIILSCLVWYQLGMILSFCWPLKYKYNMKPEDWLDCAKESFIHGLFGPFAIFTSFPV